MKNLYITLSFSLLLFAGFTASAQNKYAISGTVTNAEGKPLKSATVFLSGSQLITICDDAGKFKFDRVDEGNYQLTVTMVGHKPFAQNVVIQGKSITVPVTLERKQTILQQVNIGGKDNWDEHFKLFRKVFLGTSKNAQACVILNPRVINFSTNKGLLLADADDFLIIENPNLGYRIKYLLKDFGYNVGSDLALFNGETSFEPMTGTPKMQKKWEENRLETYKGSTMHFLRSVYQNNVLKEGFIINYIYRAYTNHNFANEERGKLLIDERPVKFDTLVTAIDTAFISLKFKLLMFTYDPGKARSIKTNSAYAINKAVSVTGKTTTIKLYTHEAIIDRTGAHRDYRDFLIEGALAKDRVGDQLPFEYQPPAKM